MKQSERGYTLLLAIAAVAVTGIIAGVIITADPEGDDSVMPEKESIMDELATAETESGAGDTMMKDDPKLDELSAEELAADGPSNGQGLAGLPKDLSNQGMQDFVEGKDEMDDIAEDFIAQAPAGQFINHTSGDYSYAEEGDLVLFFHADWCPSCRGLENDINSNLSQIPDGVSIQKVDFDNSTELKKKHGVVRQHTLVQVDESGNAIKTLTGLTNTLNQVVSQL